MSKMMLV